MGKRDAKWEDTKFDFDLAVRLWKAEQSAIDRGIYPNERQNLRKDKR